MANTPSLCSANSHAGGGAAAAAGRQDLAIEHTVFPYWNSVVMMGLRRPASAGHNRAVFVPELSRKTLAFVRGNSPQCFQLLAQAAVAATLYITPPSWSTYAERWQEQTSRRRSSCGMEFGLFVRFDTVGARGLHERYRVGSYAVGYAML